MRAIPLPDCWGVDTNAKLTAATAKALASNTMTVPGHAPAPVAFVWRYVFFGSPRPGDIDKAERDIILAAGLALLLVQHVRNPGWVASGDTGEADGRVAAANAIKADYPAGVGLSLAMDLEGVRNSGQPVFEHCKRWGQAVRDGGFSPVLYVGYAAGLTPAQLYQIPTIDRYWSDYGPRAVDRRGFCCKQYAQQTSTAGFFIDPDHAFPDALGGALTALAAGP